MAQFFLRNSFFVTLAVAVVVGLNGFIVGPKQQLQSQASVPNGFAVVELFTSEGCSSCPPADENLADLAAEAARKQLPVYTLSFHVDYWNRLGWTDPFSRAEFSQRQRDYAAQLNSARVYTPQMIVNGRSGFVGSKRAEALRLINQQLRQPAAVDIAISAQRVDEQVVVTWRLNDRPAETVLNFALVQNNDSQKIATGENAGRELSHVNIVRQFRRVIEELSAGEAALAIPSGFAREQFHVVVYLQNSDWTVLAAAQSEIGLP